VPRAGNPDTWAEKDGAKPLQCSRSAVRTKDNGCPTSSLVFREMWDTTALNPRPFNELQDPPKMRPSLVRRTPHHPDNHFLQTPPATSVPQRISWFPWPTIRPLRNATSAFTAISTSHREKTPGSKPSRPRIPAAPYHDWNERITAESYAPNGASRIVNGDNQIIRIMNNYSRISFQLRPHLALLAGRECAPHLSHDPRGRPSKHVALRRPRIRHGPGLQPRHHAPGQHP